MKGFFFFLKEIYPKGQCEQKEETAPKPKTNKTRQQEKESWRANGQAVIHLAGLTKLTPKPAAERQPGDLLVIPAKGWQPQVSLDVRTKVGPKSREWVASLFKMQPDSIHCSSPCNPRSAPPWGWWSLEFYSLKKKTHRISFLWRVAQLTSGVKRMFIYSVLRHPRPSALTRHDSTEIGSRQLCMENSSQKSSVLVSSQRCVSSISLSPGSMAD